MLRKKANGYDNNFEFHGYGCFGYERITMMICLIYQSLCPARHMFPQKAAAYGQIPDRALEILNWRFAKGEIREEEYSV